MNLRSKRVLEQSEDVQSDSFSCSSEETATIVHAPIDKLGAPFRWLRHKLLDGILVGTPVVLTIQRHRTPNWNRLMRSVSFMGTEDFYTIMIVLLIWIFDSRLGRLFCMLMSVGFYITGVLKTALRLPRPPSPPVRPLESAFDWALPSHHSLMGTILPWYIWLYLPMHFKLTSLQLPFCFMAILFWSISVLFSRLYLGVHSPADILSGGFIGVIILSLWMQVDDFVDFFISRQSIDVPLQVGILFVILIYIHPTGDPGNPSMSDSCCVFGVAFGVIVGRSQRSNALGWPALLEKLPSSTSYLTILSLAICRLALGAVIVLVVRLICKKIFSIVLMPIINLIGLEYYSSKAYRRSGAVPSRHYSADFVLPPIAWNNKKSSKIEEEEDLQEKESSDIPRSMPDSFFTFWHSKSSKISNDISSNPWDIDIFAHVLIYPIITYLAVEVLPRTFLLFNI